MADETVKLEAAKAILDALIKEQDSVPARIQRAAAASDPKEITTLRRRLAEVTQEIQDAQIVVSLLQEADYRRIADEADFETTRLYPIAAAADDAFVKAAKEKERAFGDWQDAMYRAREYRGWQAQERQRREGLSRQLRKQAVDRALSAPI